MTFVRVASTRDIPEGHGTLVERDGHTLAVFNAGGGHFYACGAICPHEGGPLAEGWIDTGAVVCPWHGFDFDLETGQCRVEPEMSVPLYAVRVQGDAVEVDLA